MCRHARVDQRAYPRGHEPLPRNADDLPLERWLSDYIFPAEKQNLDDDSSIGDKTGMCRDAARGVTTFCDMYLFEDSAARAAKEMGMRGSWGGPL